MRTMKSYNLSLDPTTTDEVIRLLPQTTNLSSTVRDFLEQKLNALIKEENNKGLVGHPIEFTIDSGDVISYWPSWVEVAGRRARSVKSRRSRWGGLVSSNVVTNLLESSVVHIDDSGHEGVVSGSGAAFSSV